MAKTLLAQNSIGLGFSGGTTRYIGVRNGNSSIDTTEANTQIIFETAGTLSNFYLYISTNSVAAVSTYSVRNNGSNGNLVISTTASTTGAYSDNTHTDSISAGNKMGIQIVPGGAGSLSIDTVTFQFDASTNTTARFGGYVGTTSANSTTIYAVPSGLSSFTSTEAPNQFKLKTGGTLKNLAVHISSNSRAVTDTVRSRIGGANGNLAISITSSATGFFEDTSNTDTISSGNLVNYSFTGGATANTMTMDSIASDFTTTNSTSHSISGTGGPQNMLGFSGAQLIPLGYTAPTTNEAVAQGACAFGFTASNLEVYVNSNGRGATDTVRLRVNGANVNQVVSIGAGVTGYFEDTTNSDTISATDKLNYRWAPGDGGFSAITLSSVGFLMTMAAPPSGTLPHPFIFLQAVNRAATF